jgi:hypothetical protein
VHSLCSCLRHLCACCVGVCLHVWGSRVAVCPCPPSVCSPTTRVVNVHDPNPPHTTQCSVGGRRLLMANERWNGLHAAQQRALCPTGQLGHIFAATRTSCKTFGSGPRRIRLDGRGPSAPGSYSLHASALGYTYGAYKHVSHACAWFVLVEHPQARSRLVCGPGVWRSFTDALVYGLLRPGRRGPPGPALWLLHYHRECG